MDYRRTYWLCFLAAGLLFGVLNILDYRATGETWELVMTGVAALVVVVSTYAVANPDRVGGPDEFGPRFIIAVGAFLLFLVLVVQRVLGG